MLLNTNETDDFLFLFFIIYLFEIEILIGSQIIFQDFSRNFEGISNIDVTTDLMTFHL